MPSTTRPLPVVVVVAVGRRNDGGWDDEAVEQRMDDDPATDDADATAEIFPVAFLVGCEADAAILDEDARLSSFLTVVVDGRMSFMWTTPLCRNVVVVCCGCELR